MITDEELAKAIKSLRISGTDSQDIEVKASVGKLPASIVESVSAFANASGGVVVLGLSESEEFAPRGRLRCVQNLRRARRGVRGQAHSPGPHGRQDRGLRGHARGRRRHTGVPAILQAVTSRWISFFTSAEMIAGTAKSSCLF